MVSEAVMDRKKWKNRCTLDVDFIFPKIWRELAPFALSNGCQGFKEPDLSTLLYKTILFKEVNELQI